MKKNHLFSRIRNAVVLSDSAQNCLSKNGHRRPDDLRFEHLEIRNLLATIAFDSATSLLTFNADAGEADVVTVDALDANTLQIQVGGGDAIVLGGDAIGNADFALSQTTTPDDTLQIDVGSTAIDEFIASLGDMNDMFTVSGLTGVASLSIGGDEGNDTLNTSAISADVTLIGGSGDDQLTGGSGNDRLVGGFGADELNGGDGDDSLIGSGQIEVTVTNLGASDGILLTPVFLATQNGVYDFFNVGSPASENLERLAEDGTTGPRVDAALASGGVGEALVTDGGPLMPGDSRTVTFFADPSDPLTRYLSYASMVIPSNDAFIGNDGPTELDLFDSNGSLIRRTGASALIVTGDEVWDAGTEVNDEIPENTAALNQTVPNTGVTEGGVVQQHPGFQGSERLGGPVGNILTARPGADFTVPGAQVLSIVVDATIDGDDILNGGSGNDLLSGGEGNDTLSGGTGNDELLGGDGDDLLMGGGGTDTISGGIGVDTNSFAGIGLGVTATVAADGTGTASYGAVNEAFTGIENLTGSDNNDVLVATGAAANVLSGGDGNDLLAGGGGADVIDGGAGVDTNSFAGIGADVTATINADGTGTASYGAVNETFAGIENLTGSDNNDTLTGNDLVNVIDGGLGNDVISGLGGDDILFGGSGDDRISGGNDNDRLVGGFGADQLDGDDGSDSLIGGGQIEVTVTNLAPSDGSLLTPVFLATQNGVYDFFDVGSAASENLERLAEDGTTGPRVDAALASGGVSEALVTAGGPLMPGESRTVTFFADPSDPLTQYLSYASMVIPSNDAFIGNDDPLQLDLFDSNGSLIRRIGAEALIVTGDEVWDAGTEVNDEIPENTAALAQSAPNTGVTEGGVVQQHPGFQGSARLGGPIGNILTARPGSDFTLPGAQILSIEVDAEVDGDDILNGGNGDDVLSGGEGNDTLSGGIGNDELLGGDGDDLLLGDEGDDMLSGNAGNDILRGADGNDTAFGGVGNDALNGGAGDDFLRGEDGDDFLVGITGTDDIDGGAGTDTNSFQEVPIAVNATVNADGTGTAVYGSVNESFAGIENLIGSAFDDILLATGVANNTLIGLEGNDLINGGGGDDLLIGDLGNDILRGAAGNDRALGGPGNDALNGGEGDDFLAGDQGDDFFVGIGGTDTILGGEGVDTNSFQGVGTGVTVRINDDGTGVAQHGASNEFFVGIESLVGSSNADVLIVNGVRDTLLQGLGGNDLLVGGSGNDVLVGGDGNDVIRGGSGNDVGLGGLGADFIEGGNGNDILRGDEGSDTLSGGNDDDLILGSTGNDFLFGNDGIDMLFGEDGDDVLIGGLGLDSLFGGDGTDEEIQ